MSDDMPFPDKKPETTQEFEALHEQGATDATDPLAGWSRKQPRYKERELAEDEQGQTYLVVRKLIRKRFRIGNGKRRVRHYRLEEKYILLDDSDLVEMEIATKTAFIPTDAESRIVGLARKSQWSFMPVIVTMWLALLFIAIAVPSITHEVRISPDVYAGFIGLTGLLCACVTVPLWIRWSSFRRIITNERLIEEYRPPLGLPGFERSVLIIDASTGFAPEDVSLLTNLLGRWSFGNVASDTPSDDDDWLKKLTFVKFHEDVAEVLNAQRGMYRARDEEERRLSIEANQAIIDNLGGRDDAS